MASPLGHSLVSCYFLRSYARLRGQKEPSVLTALPLIVLASLPDLDICLDGFNALTSSWHRGFTHSFFFALWIGCVIALLESLISKGPLLKRAALYGAVVATHPMVDYLAVIPPYLGAMPLFWPFSSNYFASPQMILISVYTYNSPVTAYLSFLKTFAAESALLLPLLAYELYLRMNWAGSMRLYSILRHSIFWRRTKALTLEE